MVQLAILLLFPFLVSGLIRTNNDISGFEDNGLFDTWAGFESLGKVERRGPLWILKLGGDLDDLTLRKGSRREEEEFEDAFGATIEALACRQGRRVKKDDPAKTQDEDVYDDKMNGQIKKDILRIVNKFVLSTSKEPDVYINESNGEDEPTLALYFQGPYTSLTVQFGNKQWNYFMGPPSPLPAWFYEQGLNQNDQKVPIQVRTNFYKALVHMLHMFLSIPV